MWRHDATVCTIKKKARTFYSLIWDKSLASYRREEESVWCDFVYCWLTFLSKQAMTADADTAGELHDKVLFGNHVGYGVGANDTVGHLGNKNGSHLDFEGRQMDLDMAASGGYGGYCPEG